MKVNGKKTLSIPPWNMSIVIRHNTHNSQRNVAVLARRVLWIRVLIRRLVKNNLLRQRMRKCQVRVELLWFVYKRINFYKRAMHSLYLCDTNFINFSNYLFMWIFWLFFCFSLFLCLSQSICVLFYFRVKRPPKNLLCLVRVFSDFFFCKSTKLWNENKRLFLKPKQTNDTHSIKIEIYKL